MKTFIANVKSPVGVWSVVGTDEGVTHIHLPQDELPASKGVPFPNPSLTRSSNSRSTSRARGARSRCNSRRLPATDFQRDVWGALRKIPYGQVRTYGEVATR
jgi:methylated-DNA-[protein]-cysteine S-methyltransferase